MDHFFPQLLGDFTTVGADGVNFAQSPECHEMQSRIVRTSARYFPCFTHSTLNRT